MELLLRLTAPGRPAPASLPVEPAMARALGFGPAPTDSCTSAAGGRVGNRSGQRWIGRPQALASQNGQSGRLLRHVLDARQFTREWLEQALFPSALELQQTPIGRIDRTLSGKRLFYLFYEASTRTRVSFEMAVALLGARRMASHSGPM
jgi:Aspartate/ornithine carbamoyltransferase, carbamoyl-P binding domain